MLNTLEGSPKKHEPQRLDNSHGSELAAAASEGLIMKPNHPVDNPATVKVARSKADQFSATPYAIAVLAYKFWTERGRPIGSPEEDWFRAEREIKHNRTPGSVI